MTLRGTFRNGKVEVDAGAEFPDGTRVDIHRAPAAGAERLLDDALRLGVRNTGLPKDYASELDHYQYGTPKRGKAGKRKPGRTATVRKSSRATKGRASRKRR